MHSRIWHLIRVALLIGLGAGLMQPYLTHGTIGGADAVKYANWVSDFVLQARAGVFPIWVGQTDFQMFGGTYPLRFAPYLQHLAGLVDLLTARSLPLFYTLNAALAASVIGGLVSGYVCLRAVTPSRPWVAWALAVLYVLCPGVLGLPYTQDLFMSCSTLPFLPVIFLGVVRSFDRNDLASRLLMAAGLAGAWLAHPPIAMWSGIVVVATQGVRLYQLGFTKRALRLDAIALATFSVLAGYSFVSVKGLAAQWQQTEVINVDNLLFQIRQAFPGNWQPLPRDVLLENLQLGYGLAAILGLNAAALSLGRREPLQIAFVGCALALAVLIVPVPVLTPTLWKLMPQTVLNVTNIWPMQRLPVVIALCVVFGAALLARRIPARSWLANGCVAALLLGAVAWGASQVRHVIIKTNRSAPSIEATRRTQRPENLILPGSGNGIRVVAPRYASGGVMDPQLEHHFLDVSTRELRSSVADAVAPGYGPGPRGAARPLTRTFTGKLNANPGVLDLQPTLRLEPGRRYLLAFDFIKADYSGILMISGPEFSRQYRLPLSGESRSFGSGPESSRVIPLWTTLDRAEEVQLQFVPTGAGQTPMDFVPFAHFELLPYDPRELPVQLESFFPYRSIVRTDQPVLLETPKLHIPNYAATVDGVAVPVQVSFDGYVSVPVNPGTHRVTVSYVPPLALLLAFWTSAGGWLALAAALVFRKRWEIAPWATCNQP